MGILAQKSQPEYAKFPIFMDVSFAISLIVALVVSVLAYFNFVHIEIKFYFIICFSAAKKSAVSDVERCFDEARELVRKSCFLNLNVKI